MLEVAEGGGAGGWLVFRPGSAVDDLTANRWNFTNVDAVSLLIGITAAMKETQDLQVMVIVRPRSESVILLVPLQQQTDCGAVTPPLHL